MQPMTTVYPRAIPTWVRKGYLVSLLAPELIFIFLWEYVNIFNVFISRVNDNDKLYFDKKSEKHSLLDNLIFTQICFSQFNIYANIFFIIDTLCQIIAIVLVCEKFITFLKIPEKKRISFNPILLNRHNNNSITSYILFIVNIAFFYRHNTKTRRNDYLMIL